MSGPVVPETTAAPTSAFLSGLEGISLVSRAQYVNSIPSTNTRLLEGTDGPGTVLIADEQTAGRGRRGRQWHAPPGTSLMFSVALEPRLPPEARGLLALVAGNALVVGARALPGLGAVDLGLKWPNDLLIDGVKVAGILAEGVGDRVVVGMGINVDWTDVRRPEGVTATSLAEASGTAVDRWDLLEQVLSALDIGVRSAERDPAAVVPAYLPDCVTIGRSVTATLSGQPVTGVAVGLTAVGHLRVRRPDGRDAVVTAGEVHHLR